MIQLTKLNKEPFVLNCNHIEAIEVIPESKVVLTNGRFYIVEETTQEIIDKVIAYNALVVATSKTLETAVIDRTMVEA